MCIEWWSGWCRIASFCSCSNDGGAAADGLRRCMGHLIGGAGNGGGTSLLSASAKMSSPSVNSARKFIVWFWVRENVVFRFALPKTSRPRTGGRSDCAWTAVFKISRNSLRDDDDDDDVFPLCDTSSVFSILIVSKTLSRQQQQPIDTINTCHTLIQTMPTPIGDD